MAEQFLKFFNRKESRQFYLANNNPVVLQGIHISFHTPTEERLTVQIESMTPEEFRALGFAVEDWSKEVDENYKKRRVRGRGWKGRGKRVSDSQRLRVLRFSAFPSSFSNELRMLRRDLYISLHQNCLVLEGEPRGFKKNFKQNIYILPYGNAPPLMVEIQRCNSVIDDLNQKIQEFLGTSYFRNLQEMLQQHGVGSVLDGATWHIEHMSFDATPLALNPSTVKEIVEDEYQRAFQKISKDQSEAETLIQQRYQEGMQDLYEELQRKEKDLVVKAVQNMQKKLNVIVAKIVGAHKLSPKTVKEELDRLRRIAESVGLEAIATTIIDPLKAVVDDPDKAFELLGSIDIEKGVSNRITSMIDKL